MSQKDSFPIIFFVIFLSAFWLSSCTQINSAPANTLAPASSVEVQPTQQPPLPATQPSPGLDDELLKNLVYNLGIVKESQNNGNGVISLKDGKFEQALQNSAAKLSVDYVDSAIGDLNGDGSEDAVVLLAVNTGGSGTFMQLAAVLNQNGQIKHIDTADLGDRTKIESIRIQDGTIMLETIVHSDTDPLCCPSLERLQEYTLQGERLVGDQS